MTDRKAGLIRKHSVAVLTRKTPLDCMSCSQNCFVPHLLKEQIILTKKTHRFSSPHSTDIYYVLCGLTPKVFVRT